jgi:hypothetical protein
LQNESALEKLPFTDAVGCHQIFQRLPLLSSLMPYIASSIAFADGVYLEEEHAIVVPVKNHVTA